MQHSGTSVHLRLNHLLRTLDDPTLINRMMGVADRTLALALWGCDESLRRRLLSFVRGRKRLRVDEELALLDRRRFGRAERNAAFATLIAALDGKHNSAGKGYLRPVSRDPAS